MSARIRDERGFILIAALWLLVALGAAGLHAGLRMRTERLASANVLDEARAQQVALAGAEYARSHLTGALLDRADELRAQAASAATGRNAQQQRAAADRARTQSVTALFRSADIAEDPWRDPQGLVIPEMRFGDAIFTLHLRDVAAALNPNTANEQMLLGFFSQGLELDYAVAEKLTQAMLDWRDEDDLPRVGGGERDDYLKAGLPVLPMNQPFGTIDDLRHVMGMTQEIFSAALPYLSIVQGQGGQGGINLNAAPFAVLLALPGMTTAAATQIVSLREGGTFPTSTNQLFQLLPAGASAPLRAAGNNFTRLALFRTDVVEILADGRVEGSAVEARVRLVVSRSNQGAQLLYREFN